MSRLAIILDLPKRYEFYAQIEIYKNIAYKCRREIENNQPRILANEENRLYAIELLVDFFTQFLYRNQSEEISFSFCKNILDLCSTILSKIKHYFYQRNRHVVDIVERVALLAEAVIVTSPKTHNRFDFYRNLLNIVDSCSKTKGIFDTRFDLKYFHKLSSLVEPGCSYTAKISQARNHEYLELLTEEQLGCSKAVFAIDCLVQEDHQSQPNWFSKILNEQKLSIDPFARFTRQFNERAEIMIARMENENTAWGFVSKEDQMQHGKILQELLKITTESLYSRKVESRRFNKVYLAVIKERVKRVLVTCEGNLFDCETGIIISNPGIEVFEPTSQLLKTEPKIVFIILDKIAPRPVSTTLVTTYLRSLLRLIKEDQRSIPDSPYLLLTVMKNYKIYPAEARYCCACIILLMASKNDTDNYYAKNRVRDFLETVRSDSFIQTLLEISAIDCSSEMESKLSTKILSLFSYSISNKNNVECYQMARKLIKHGIFKLVTKFKGREQEILYDIIKNICMLAIVYNDQNMIITDKCESKNSRLAEFNAKKSACQIEEEWFSDSEDEPVDASSISSGIQKEFPTISERDRIDELIEAKSTVFKSAADFNDGITDGSICDYAASFLNGDCKGELWLGVSNHGHIQGVSADLHQQDLFKSRMFKLMRSMFPPVQTQHFSIDFFQVKSQEDTVKCIARLCFTPDGHLYSTPQKRCLVREWSEENGIWYMKVLDTSEIVKKALKQEESEYRIEIHRLKRCLEAIKKVNN